jgi:actin-related protein
LLIVIVFIWILKMVLYNGNEVSALVFDIGSSSSKIGYAGADAPSYIFPTVGAYSPAPSSISSSTESAASGYLANIFNWFSGKFTLGYTSSSFGQELDWTRRPITEGVVTDWDALEAVWQHAYDSCLRTSASDHPLMITESAWAEPAQREKMAELAFEKFGVPALYFAPSPVLAAFSAARSTALVIDSGAEMTSVVPVVDSFVMKKCMLIF